MFWSSPSGDLEVSLFLTAITLLVTVLVYWKYKKVLLSVTVFSILEYFIFLGTVNHRFAAYYGVDSLVYFIRNIWPVINVLLVAILVGYYIVRRRKNK